MVAISRQERRRTAVQRHAICWATALLQSLWVVWLLPPSHHPRLDRSILIDAANLFVLVMVAIMEI